MQELRARVAGAADPGPAGLRIPLRSPVDLQPHPSFTRPSHAER